MEEKASNPLVKENTTDTLMHHSKGARDREHLWPISLMFSRGKRNLALGLSQSLCYSIVFGRGNLM